MMVGQLRRMPSLRSMLLLTSSTYRQACEHHDVDDQQRQDERLAFQIIDDAARDLGRAHRSTSRPRLARRRLRCARTVWPLIVTRALVVRCGDGDVDHSLGSGGGTGIGKPPFGLIHVRNAASFPLKDGIDDVFVGPGAACILLGRPGRVALPEPDAGAREVSPFRRPRRRWPHGRHSTRRKSQFEARFLGYDRPRYTRRSKKTLQKLPINHMTPYWVREYLTDLTGGG